MEGSSPARLYCLLTGVALVAAGIIGFFYESSFDTAEEVVADDVFGILAVNGWHNVVHILLGVLGLAAAGYAARAYALGVGAVYIVLAVLGFIAVESTDGIDFVAENGVLIDLVPVNTEDNVLHAILGVLGIAAGLATPRAVAAAPAT
jgi:hypothetical protein